MKPIDLKFDIGDWVQFSKTQHRYVNDTTREVRWETTQSPLRKGRVVGIARRQDGTVKGNTVSYGYDGTDYYEPGYLHVKKVNNFYEVRTGWVNKPFLVKEEDLELCSKEEVYDLPILHTPQYWSEKDKEFQREEMKDWPRDSKGRWIKETIR